MPPHTLSSSQSRPVAALGSATYWYSYTYCNIELHSHLYLYTNMMKMLHRLSELMSYIY